MFRAVHSRLFAMPAWTKWLPSGSDLLPVLGQPHAGVESVRHQILGLLEDCHGVECERLRWRLHTAGCAQDLWMLRGPLFQVIASQHCQSQAAERVNALLPAFQELLPQRMLSRV